MQLNIAMEEANKRKQKTALFRKLLAESSDEQIIGLLTELRESGEDFMVPLLAELLFEPNSEKLKEAVSKLLVDLKNKKNAEVLAEVIRKHTESPELHRLLAICWQSRLDFSPYIDLFVSLFIQSDFQTSFEAFSVIENSLTELSGEQVEALYVQLSSQDNITSDKQPLHEELLQVIRSFRK